MSNYVMKDKTPEEMAEELQHWGVKGMKWGVRKDQRQAYKEDRKELSGLINSAKYNSQWSKAYRRAEKIDSRKLTRRIDKDMTKRGVLSAKTKSLQSQNERLKTDKQFHDYLTSESIRKAKEFIAGMKKEYGDKTVKDLKTYIKDGQEFVKGRRSLDFNALYNVVKIGDQYVPIRTTYW